MRARDGDGGGGGVQRLQGYGLVRSATESPEVLRGR